MTKRLKLGDQTFYTIEEAAQVLHPLYTEATLRRKAYENKLPHHGGRGRGKVCFSNDDLIQIMEASASPMPLASEPVAPAPLPEEVIELPDFFRQTDRSRAIHRGKAVA